MILIVDAGNTTITFAAVDLEREIIVRRFKTEEEKLQADAFKMLNDRPRGVREILLDSWCNVVAEELCQKEYIHGEKLFEKAVISCVVSEDEQVLEWLADRLTEKVVMVDKENCGLDLSHYTAETLGADRMADTVAAIEKYGQKLPIIVFDLGTATTCNVIDENGCFLGGIIAPGLMTGAESLLRNASKLKTYNVYKPDSIIGKSTQNCINSGLVYGHALMVDGMIDKINKELGKKCCVVITGGNTELISSCIESQFFFEPDLLLYGLINIAKKN